MTDDRPPDAVDDVVGFWHSNNPDLDVMTKCLSMRLRRTGHLLERATRAELATLDMESWEVEMLFGLLRSPDSRATAGALQKMAQVTSGAITNRLSRLEQHGWVRRDVDPGDRRQVIVSLTPAGHDRAQQLMAAKTVAEQRFFAGVDRATLERMGDDLRTLMATLDDSAPCVPSVVTSAPVSGQSVEPLAAVAAGAEASF